MEANALPVLVVGAGAMGGALIEGWLRSGALAPAELMIRDPAPGEAALAAGAAGARLNPPEETLIAARSIVLAVKPHLLETVLVTLAPSLSPEAAVVSIMAGAPSERASALLGGRAVARMMPTTAAAICKGAFSLWAPTESSRRHARALFEPLGSVVDLADEDQLHLATAVSGSAPAYFYAFVEALQRAAERGGIAADAARRLARATLIGAAALLEESGAEPDVLRRQVTSPGGTTAAALEVLMAQDGLARLVERAVAAAADRSRALAEQWL